ARCLLSTAYRGQVCLGLRRLWRSLESDCPLPWRAALVFVTAPAFVFLLANQRTLTNGDTWPVVPTATALFRTGSCRLDAAVRQAPACYGHPLPYSVVAGDRGIYSGYPSGMVPFVMPWVGLAELCGAHVERPVMQMRLEKWSAASVTALSL